MFSLTMDLLASDFGPLAAGEDVTGSHLFCPDGPMALPEVARASCVNPQSGGDGNPTVRIDFPDEGSARSWHRGMMVPYMGTWPEHIEWEFNEMARRAS
jgi:hypothetical protein